MRYESNYPFYGQKIGILVFSTTIPRIKGDAGHAETFEFPVRYEIVSGGFKQLINGGKSIERNLMRACENLKRVGVKAIIGDCGLMSLYQVKIAESINLPVAASSLCQIPLIWELSGRNGTIGILTGHSDFLREKHLRNSGWRDDINIKIQGLQNEPHFDEIIIKGGMNLNVELMQKDVLNAASHLVKSTPDLKAIIFECSNIASFSNDCSKKFRIPVFDIISIAKMLEYSINPTTFL